MGKRQRARLRGSLATYAEHTLRVIQDETGGVPLISLDQIVAAQAEADRLAKGEPLPVTPPTPLEMLARSLEDISRLEFELLGRVWRTRDGKEGVLVDVKFDRLGNPVYRFQLANGQRETHPAATVHKHWTKQRVYFLVDEATGRPILPAVA